MEITALEYMKMESILHKVLLSEDIEKEIYNIGKDEIYNDKMYHYISMIVNNIDINKYYFYRTNRILDDFKSLLYLINKNNYKSEIIELRSKMNEVKAGSIDNLIQIQSTIRTMGNFFQLSKYAYDLYCCPVDLKEQMKKDYDLICYFEGKDCELDSDNIRSLIYFYNMMKYVYYDVETYRKTIMLLNTNLAALKERGMVFSTKYSDNKKLLKELGGRRV